jgi:hypothetical protein
MKRIISSMLVSVVAAAGIVATQAAPASAATYDKSATLTGVKMTVTWESTSPTPPNAPQYRPVVVRAERVSGTTCTITRMVANYLTGNAGNLEGFVDTGNIAATPSVTRTFAAGQNPWKLDVYDPRIHFSVQSSCGAKSVIVRN